MPRPVAVEVPTSRVVLVPRPPERLLLVELDVRADASGWQSSPRITEVIAAELTISTPDGRAETRPAGDALTGSSARLVTAHWPAAEDEARLGPILHVLRNEGFLAAVERRRREQE